MSRVSSSPTLLRWLVSFALLADAVVCFSTGPQNLNGASSHLQTSLSAVAAQDDVCTIQILMSDTGGGHRASANALRDAFDVLYPNRIQCDIVDIYTDYGPFWPYNDYVAMYKLMAANPWMWDLFYSFGNTEFGLWLNDLLLELFCFEPFKKCLGRDSGDTNKRADMVVSVHPLTQELPLKILAELDSGTRNVSSRTTPFCTVVTDLGSAHATWFNPGVDKCFVPSDALRKVALNRKLDPNQIIQHGLPIRKGFWDTTGETRKRFWSTQKNNNNSGSDKTKLRTKLGLDPDLPVALVVGGGDGMGGLVALGRELGDKLGRSSTLSQLVLVCGNNAEAKNQLESVSWGDGVKVSVQGFVNNMDEWMKASDALVTKAGPGTIAEASICGLPCLMFSYL